MAFRETRHHDDQDQVHLGRPPSALMVSQTQAFDKSGTTCCLLGISAVVTSFLVKLRQDLHTCVFHPFLFVLPYACTPYSPQYSTNNWRQFSGLHYISLYLSFFQLNILISIKVLLSPVIVLHALLWTHIASDPVRVQFSKHNAVFSSMCSTCNERDCHPLCSGNVLTTNQI